jgi:hypothetical protein
MKALQISKEWLENEYVQRGRSSNDIAAECGTYGSTILKHLRRHGIPIRSKGEASKGNRSWSGKRHTAEQKEKIRDSMLGKKFTDAHRRKIGAALKGRVYQPNTLQKMSVAATKKTGDKNSNWRGGTSFGPYCQKFNAPLKRDIRDKFEHRCYLCGAPENGRKLAVHHCDYNKGQGCGFKWSLVALCKSCHMKTNRNKHYYFNRQATYWAENPEINLMPLEAWAK